MKRFITLLAFAGLCFAAPKAEPRTEIGDLNGA